MRIASSGVMPWGGASSKRLPGSIPQGYASQTGYQYDSISRVAGQRDPAPPSNFSKLGGFKNSVFITDGINCYPPQIVHRKMTLKNSHTSFYSISHARPSQAFALSVVTGTLSPIALWPAKVSIGPAAAQNRRREMP